MLSLILLILCIGRGTQSIDINRIQSNTFGVDFGANLTKVCGMPCIIHMNNPKNSDAELLAALDNGDVLNYANRKSNIPIRILGSHEPTHYIPLLKLEYLNTHFQGSAVLDWDSDIPWLLMPNMDELKQIQLPEDPIPKATFVARHCKPISERNEYVQVIDSVIGVVAPGTCFHNTEWPKCGERDCSKVEAIRNYKIHLAFENGASKNYVTEKFYHAIEAGVLPVYMGTRSVSEAVPKGSYIDVADFDSPNSLALYLAKVLANDTLYQSYFEWKYKPFDKEFEDRFRVLWSVPFQCRLCRYVDAYKNNLEWDQYRQKATKTQVNNRIDIHSAHSSITQEVAINRCYGYILLCSVVFFAFICLRKRIYKLFFKLGK